MKNIAKFISAFTACCLLTVSVFAEPLDEAISTDSSSIETSVEVISTDGYLMDVFEKENILDNETEAEVFSRAATIVEKDHIQVTGSSNGITGTGDLTIQYSQNSRSFRAVTSTTEVVDEIGATVQVYKLNSSALYSSDSDKAKNSSIATAECSFSYSNEPQPLRALGVFTAKKGNYTIINSAPHYYVSE